MNTFLHRCVGWTTVAAAAACMAGCASPGPPRPPSLHLPAVIKNLRADRRGPAVVLQIETPVRSTDGFALTAPVTASVCRAVGDGPCLPTATARKTIVGEVNWVDPLPQDLATGPARKLTYRVELFNPAGRSAGRSDPAFAAGGQAPDAVRDCGLRGHAPG